MRIHRAAQHLPRFDGVLHNIFFFEHQQATHHIGVAVDELGYAVK
jgi:hypothetical protein